MIVRGRASTLSPAHPTLDRVGRVTIENLTKDFPGPGNQVLRALSGFSVTIERGELVVVVGPSGCGKTTALRLIAGLEAPTRGDIWMDGQPLNGLAPKHRDIAMVFQSPALYPHMNVRENLAFGLRLRGTPEPDMSKRLGEAVEALGLGPLLDRSPSGLSGGEQQKVALGRALVLQPKLFLLDEPLSHLDPPTRCELRRDIARLQRSLGITMLYVTHDQSEAMALASRLIVMRAGEVQQVGKSLEVYARPANLFTAGFIGSPPMNLLPVESRTEQGQYFISSAGKPPDELNWALPGPMTNLASHTARAPLVLGVRPEHLHPGNPNDGPRGSNPALVRIRTSVTWVEHLGADTLVHSRLPSGTALVWRAREEIPSEEGSEILLFAEADKVVLFDGVTGNAFSPSPAPAALV